MARLTYPIPPTSNQVDVYHGTPIADPYRPLEDADAPATKAWIAAENTLTDDLLAESPVRATIRDRLAALWNVPRAGAPWRRRARWLQLRNTGLQDQDVLWVGEGGAPGGTQARVLLDPNGLGEHGTVALGQVDASESGELVACALAEAGSDWHTWIVLRTSDGTRLADRIEWSKFSSAAWTADDAGFFYGRFPAPEREATFEARNRDMEVRYHRLGTDQAEDRLVYARPDEPEWTFEPEVADDGRLLVLTSVRGTDPESRIFAAELSANAEELGVRPILDAADALYLHVATVDGTMVLQTTKDAPLGRVIAVDVRDPTRVREVIPEGPDAVERVQLVGGRLAVVTLHDAHHRVAIFELDGRHVTDVELPAIGMVEAMTGRREDPDLYLAFVTFTAPATVLAVRMRDGRVREVGHRDLPWDPDACVTEQVFVASRDGARIPVFLTHRRDVAPNGDVPTLLYGYGGFQVAIGPMYKPEWLAWVERGGLLAVASLRGGAEYGQAWHDAGRLANKQNVFDDFAACAAWLAKDSGWTRRERIGILGRSNGGLLVGASLTQHPNLFGAAVAEVGVMDMLRFHRFTIGWGWTSDYGSSDDPEQFRTLLAYSPLHNCRPGVRYPPTLVTTGDHDDRVVPGHSLKFAAAMQAAQAGDAPILLRVDTDAGHGLGKPVGKLIDERADVIAFLDLSVGYASEVRPQGR